MTEELIDWKRVASPQPDGYDVRVMQRYVNVIGPYASKERKSLPDSSEPIWPHSDARFIKMNDYAKPHPDFQDLPRTHPHVTQGLELLELFPAILPLAHAMIALCPFSVTGTVNAQGHGGTCGNYGDDWGWIYCSADNPWGLAEGIVHEMNHWKLRAFGVWFEHWNDLLLENTPDELYDSPVRKDRPRPMGAVLHAQYSYIAVAEMCVRMLAVKDKPSSDNVAWTALQIKRITDGRETLRAHAKGTPGVGDAFLAGVDAWTSDVIDTGTDLISTLSKASV